MPQDRMQLAAITLREIKLPLIEPFRTATGTVESRRIILLELTDSDGARTWSECVAEAALNYTAETVDGAWEALTEWIAPVVLGQSFSHPTDVHAALASWVPDHHMARASVEMGMWALAAARREEPLARFTARSSAFGASTRKLVETGIAIGMHPPDVLAQRVSESVAAGYRRIKLKVSPDSDRDLLCAMREITGTSTALSVDANGSFEIENDDHVLLLRKIDELHLAMIEQPLPAHHLEQTAALQKTLATPICLDESIVSEADAESMIRSCSGSIINLKPGRVGGFTEAVAIHDRCMRAGIPVWCGGMLESGVGRAYNVALASLPNFTLPGDLSPSSRYWTRDVIEQPWTMDEKGMVAVPLDKPGIGVEVDVDYVEDLSVRKINLSA